MRILGDVLEQLHLRSTLSNIRHTPEVLTPTARAIVASGNPYSCLVHQVEPAAACLSSFGPKTSTAYLECLISQERPRIPYIEDRLEGEIQE